MTAETMVLEPDGLPDVPARAAPWQLHGSGYVIAMRLPETLIDQHAFVPPSLANKRHGHTAFLMFMDYQSSNCGPYRELLITPASFSFHAGNYPSITRIFVSTYDSVVNGRNNWGIPKDQADITLERVAPQTDRVLVGRGGELIADLTLSHHGLTLPVHSGILPAGLRTVMHHWRGKEYGVTLSAKGKLRMAKLLDGRFYAPFFPDVSRAHVIAAGYLPSFDMTFPLATVRDM